MRIILKTLTINIKNIKKLLFKTFDCQRIWTMHIWSILVHLCEFLLVPSIFRRNTSHWAECEKQLCNICSIAAKNHGMRPRSQNDKQKKLEAEMFKCLGLFISIHQPGKKPSGERHTIFCLHQENGRRCSNEPQIAQMYWKQPNGAQKYTNSLSLVRLLRWFYWVHKDV